MKISYLNFYRMSLMSRLALNFFLRCFIRPFENRKNLTVMTDTLTHRCLLDEGNSCYGIEVSKSSRIRKSKITEKIYAKEVILSGGAINTPQLLLLSGIGPRKELQGSGIDCKV